MEITAFGATGRTGLELVRQALDAGHALTVVVRDPDGLPGDLRERVKVVRADLTASGEIKAAVLGRDAVISAIGPRDPRAPAGVCAAAAEAIVTAMRSCGGGRLVIASNSAMAPGPGDDPMTRYLVKPLILRRLLAPSLADMDRAEREVRGSGLAWTIVRAGRLTDRPRKGSYRSAVDRNVFWGIQITRGDLAAAMLDVAADPAAAGRVVSVGA
ncbi:NAD(P)-dependent oxidoreductase [Actinomadura roseirufa]|uniref:NAD(P)-dependent oxidoreductase n=1 Tax=Actinomadura roseirufa TaxID=2094049 RepID=UPI0010417F68|nr:NAD(P)H-binding protein [Actinomadura roseirufa]